MKWNCSLAAAAMAMVLVPTMAQANSISSVEGARAKDRQGAWLTREDDDSLRRYGGNDDYRRYGYGYGPGPAYAYGPSYRYGPYARYDTYSYGYGYGPGFGVYVDID